MIAFEVNDMSCNHCVGAITRAVKATDEAAQVRVDLAAHRVEVESGVASPDEVAEAIQEAGYTPVRLPA